VSVIKFVLLGLAALLFFDRAGCQTKTGAPKPNAAVIHPLVPGAAPPPAFKYDFPEDTTPSFFSMAPDAAVSTEEFLWRHSATLWGLTAADELRRFRTIEVDGAVWMWFAQFHQGYQVFSEGEILLRTVDGRIDWGHARLTAGLDVDLAIRVSESTAEQLAVARAASSLRVPAAALTPAAGELVIESHRRLAWRFRVHMAESRMERSVDVDAISGIILAESELPSNNPPAEPPSDELPSNKPPADNPPPEELPWDKPPSDELRAN
jgi:hypothetical protein